MTPLTISLPDQLARTVRISAKRDHASQSAWVREAVRKQLAANRFQAVRKKLMSKAAAAGLDTDEKVFEAVS